MATARVRARLIRLLFVLLVVVPTTFALIFYGLVAAPRYVSEARFIVRSTSAPKIGGLDMLFRTFGISKSVDDTYVVEKYLLSRDAMRDLEQKGINLKAVFSRPEADRLSSYPRPWRDDSNESLFDFYLDQVRTTEDAVKGIIELQVTTFRPDDSKAIAGALLQLAEAMVNKLNERAQSDAISSAEQDVIKAQDQVIKAQSDLTSYRNRELFVDPSKSSDALLSTIGQLSQERAEAAVRLDELRKSSPKNPAVASTQARIVALDERIAAERAKMAGSDSSLASRISEYDQLVQKRDFADKILSNSLDSLQNAREQARRQRIYIEQVVEPNLPDIATEPERLRKIFTVLVLGLALFSVGWILVIGAGEHLQ